ncbi:SDR family NAD(P)-dependent oxidoreductase [candidate division GN15 bacterium]|nr:SDR family NAD(P)-dependent oxidoreductase [candidate division GN15 bacterium]
MAYLHAVAESDNNQHTTDTPTVLITGANGFVGSRLCRRFVAGGYRVIAGVRKTSDLALLKDCEVEFRYGDVTRPDTLPELVAGVDAIIHNAGVVKARQSATFFEVNEHGTRRLMDAIVEHNPDIERVVYISSLAAAGPSVGNTPRSEDDTPAPVTTYGRSKLAGERVAMKYANRLPVVAVRPPGVYGPGDREMFTLFKTVNGGIKPMIGDMRRRLQVVHVDDLCDGVFRAAATDVDPGSIYFVAEKTAYSMREFIGHFVTGSGRRCFPLIVPSWLFVSIAAVSEFFCKLIGVASMLNREKTAELLASWEIDTTRAREELGFESTIDLEQGVRETYRWYREKGWL